MPEAAMVFAAGFGTRMAPLTDKVPKPLLRVGSATLLDHALSLTEELDLAVVVNAHYKADQISAHLKNRPNVDVNIETPEILDTGGGLKAALPMLGAKPVFTLNSDAIFLGLNPLRLLAEHWNPDEMDGLMMLVPIDRAIGYSRQGNFSVDATGRLKSDPNGLIYTGVQIVNTDGLAGIEEKAFSMWRLWDQMLTTQSLFGIEYPGSWMDIGTPEGLSAAVDRVHGDV